VLFGKPAAVMGVSVAGQIRRPLWALNRPFR